MKGPIDTAGAKGMEVPAEALQDVYDIAVNSMDFGSGFLSTEEVQHLRQLGKAIGAEPLHYQCKSWRRDGSSCTCGAEDVPVEEAWFSS